MRFMLDENVPIAVADMLQEHGHQAKFIRDYVPAGAADPLVALVAEQNDCILLSFDGDFQKISPRIPDGHKARFRRLSRIWLRCNEPAGAGRLEGALVFVETEFTLAQLRADQRMQMTIGSSYLRTER
jgi:predicted nuclease of predicted toxin-antitoxin system